MSRINENDIRVGVCPECNGTGRNMRKPGTTLFQGATCMLCNGVGNGRFAFDVFGWRRVVPVDEIAGRWQRPNMEDILRDLKRN